MMRNKTASSMQKTYDECYLICSTAVYFEGQNNEPEALRSWRSALDRIYYHNAYRVPPDYRPKTETERALQESLRTMELQCKERVSLLEALRDSRMEKKKKSEEDALNGSSAITTPAAVSEQSTPGWIGGGTIPAVNYPDLARPGPSLPKRPSFVSEKSSQRIGTLGPSSSSLDFTKPLTPNPPPVIQTSRNSSPEKKGRMKTTLRTSKEGKKPSKPKAAAKRPPAADAAAGLAWNTSSRPPSQTVQHDTELAKSNATTDRSDYESMNDREDLRRGSHDSVWKAATRSYSPPSKPSASAYHPTTTGHADSLGNARRNDHTIPSSRLRSAEDHPPPSPSLDRSSTPHAGPSTGAIALRPEQIYKRPDALPYRNEYPTPAPISQANITAAVRRPKDSDGPLTSPDSPGPLSPQRRVPPPVPIHRRPVSGNSGMASSSRSARPAKGSLGRSTSSESADETTSSRDHESGKSAKKPARKKRGDGGGAAKDDVTPDSSDQDSEHGSLESDEWRKRVAYLKKHLPKGVDPFAAKQIFNEIVVRGDEVHWSDVAGLDNAKKALKEAVVYPFLRPDLFMGLREPARGMLLFGPPGTGKTMLARAVATESRSTFFAISASSLTSKWLGDSEKLVRALFQLARALAPSIIFVDEIDSLLSSRGGSSEHESTRRIKTEFLIQWSDLQRAAAGKEQSEKEKREGDASRVLVLAATNMPWAIDEAARRRFVRRQYIPLPEPEVRAQQLRTLLGHQKHDLNDEDIEVLVQLTDGYSGSDITALAKDAAMGPLRSLGEALLSMSMDEIRPISFEDFEASLINIRPSVSKQGLKEFEDWARDYGERGG